MYRSCLGCMVPCPAAQSVIVRRLQHSGPCSRAVAHTRTDERHLCQHRSPQVGPLVGDHAHQQAARGAALRRNALLGRPPRAHKVVCAGDEVGERVALGQQLALVLVPAGGRGASKTTAGESIASTLREASKQCVCVLCVCVGRGCRGEKHEGSSEDRYLKGHSEATANTCERWDGPDITACNPQRLQQRTSPQPSSHATRTSGAPSRRRRGCGRSRRRRPCRTG